MIAISGLRGVFAAILLTVACVQANAQQPTTTPAPNAVAAPASAPALATIEKLSGVWVEGPGFEITYGKDYQNCTQRCLSNPKCVMIEYYRPEKKCNLYDTMRPRKTGGSSDVGIRK
jgi:PAN domain